MSRLKWTGDADCEPVRRFQGDAGFDLVTSEKTTIPGGEFQDVPCGIRLELPPGVWGLIIARSSTLRRRGLLVQQGVVDNGYRGAVFVGTYNLSEREHVVERGERIAQLLPFAQYSRDMVPSRVEKLSVTDRGGRGFGSTGL